MEIIMSTRHAEVKDAVKEHAKAMIEAEFADLRLKISKATMVFDEQRNVFKATLSVSIKDIQVDASSEAFDNQYKAIDEAVVRAGVQARKYLDKKQDHKKDSSIKGADLPDEEKQTED